MVKNLLTEAKKNLQSPIGIYLMKIGELNNILITKNIM